MIIILFMLIKYLSVINKGILIIFEKSQTPVFENLRRINKKLKPHNFENLRRINKKLKPHNFENF